MKSFYKYLSVIALCLSAFMLSGCLDGEYSVGYDYGYVVRPTYYYRAYPRYYYTPRPVYSRPAPPPRDPKRCTGAW